jgi:hypothetical protein
MFRLQLGLVLSLALLFAGCIATATPIPPANAGVEGQVLIGPMCPVVQAGTPCPDQPFQATLTFLDQNGNTVSRTQSDAQGKFRVSLPPGTYTLRPEPANRQRHRPRAGADRVRGRRAVCDRDHHLRQRHPLNGLAGQGNLP